ncbi:MAG: hypothetical protein HXX13_02360 [Bacteroidetes bacterium]|nr:hypothetical protein [Bacteroidota bacterium]
MKNHISLLLIVLCLFTAYNNAFSRPIYINFHLGFLAKFEVVSGECHDGWGICLSYAQGNLNDNASLGYDTESGTTLFLKIPKSNSDPKCFSEGKFEVKEDSPIDPLLISKFSQFRNPNKKIVTIKKGLYPVKTEGENYLIALNYYLL